MYESLVTSLHPSVAVDDGIVPSIVLDIVSELVIISLIIIVATSILIIKRSIASTSAQRHLLPAVVDVLLFLGFPFFFELEAVLYHLLFSFQKHFLFFKVSFFAPLFLFIMALGANVKI